MAYPLASLHEPGPCNDMGLGVQHTESNRIYGGEPFCFSAGRAGKANAEGTYLEHVETRH